MIPLVAASGLWLALLLAPVPLIPAFDLPLMPGLVEQADARAAFDKLEGRILETQLAGTVSLTETRTFYQDAVTGLGWQALPEATSAAALVFVRGSDRLTIDLTQAGTLVLVRLLLEPAQPKKDEP